MLTILLHSSKTMRSVPTPILTHEQSPIFLKESEQLRAHLMTLSKQELQECMAISAVMAENVYTAIHTQDYSPLPSIDIFLGDIYSGLQVQSFTDEDREYANAHLYILSGLYGVLRAMDTIHPYRLEMGYKLPHFGSLYEFWGDKIARQLPIHQTVVNLSAKEYTKAVFPYTKKIDGLKDVMVISPKFLTISPKTGEPTFVTVHAKVARGAFARWIIQHRIEDASKLRSFDELGYSYDSTLSTENEPVFVAKKFEGLGLSVRLT